MYSKTSIKHRLGPLTGLWVLRTTVQDATDTCYFFRMGTLFYQAKLAELNLGVYLCQVEALPEDVEALTPTVPKGTVVQEVVVEESKPAGGARKADLCLKMEDGSCLRFGLDEDNIGTTMSYGMEDPAPVPARRTVVEMCGFDAPAIPLPTAAVRSRRLVLLAGFVGFIACFVLAYMFEVTEMSWLVVTVSSICMGAMLAAVRASWRFRCPYCGKARMRPRVNLSTYVCPRCGGVCRPVSK